MAKKGGSSKRGSAAKTSSKVEKKATAAAAAGGDEPAAKKAKAEVTTSTTPAAAEADGSAKALDKGDMVPDLDLAFHDGSSDKLEAILKDSGVVIFSYPKANTPG